MNHPPTEILPTKKPDRAPVLWLTGYSGSGKTTLANGLKIALAQMNRQAFVLDGDELRTGLNQGLGFSKQDRLENIRRTAEVAKLFSEAGIITIVSLISPYAQARENARRIIGENYFSEVFVNCPIEIASRRDPKGLYAMAAKGEIINFTGIDSVYEVPAKPDLEIRTDLVTEQEAVKMLVDLIQETPRRQE